MDAAFCIQGSFSHKKKVWLFFFFFNYNFNLDFWGIVCLYGWNGVITTISRSDSLGTQIHKSFCTSDV